MQMSHSSDVIVRLPFDTPMFPVKIREPPNHRCSHGVAPASSCPPLHYLQVTGSVTTFRQPARDVQLVYALDVGVSVNYRPEQCGLAGLGTPIVLCPTASGPSLSGS